MIDNDNKMDHAAALGVRPIYISVYIMVYRTSGTSCPQRIPWKSPSLCVRGLYMHVDKLRNGLRRQQSMPDLS